MSRDEPEDPFVSAIRRQAELAQAGRRLTSGRA